MVSSDDEADSNRCRADAVAELRETHMRRNGFCFAGIVSRDVQGSRRGGARDGKCPTALQLTRAKAAPQAAS